MQVYHIVFAAKYRRQLIYGKIKAIKRKILRELSEIRVVEILVVDFCSDYIHMFGNIVKHEHGILKTGAV